MIQVDYKPTVRDRNRKRPAPARKAKSIVTRVQNMDEVMRSRIVNRAREVLNKHNCEGMERPSFESLEKVLLRDFESKVIARHRHALRTFLEDSEDVGVDSEVRLCCCCCCCCCWLCWLSECLFHGRSPTLLSESSVVVVAALML